MGKLVGNVNLLDIRNFSRARPVLIGSTVFSFLWLARRIWTKTGTGNRLKKPDVNVKKKFVVITGCDSGLGLAMAYWSAGMGYKVLAGCLDPLGQGSEYLKRSGGHSDLVEVVHLDVTSQNDIKKLKSRAEELVLEQGLEMGALICNAAILMCGEFLWLPAHSWDRCMDVNFGGTTKIVSEFREILLKQKGRVVVVTSDCSEIPLPGLAAYSASKAALEVWARALRLEVGKYGIQIVPFRPGSFPKKSRLFSNQNQVYEEMRLQLTQRELDFYGEYLHRFNNYLIEDFSKGSTSTVDGVLNDSILKGHFTRVLQNDMSGIGIYDYSPLDSRIFHFLVKWLPQCMSDGLLKNVFQNNAKWTPKEY